MFLKTHTCFFKYHTCFFLDVTRVLILFTHLSKLTHIFFAIQTYFIPTHVYFIPTHTFYCNSQNFMLYKITNPVSHFSNCYKSHAVPHKKNHKSHISFCGFKNTRLWNFCCEWTKSLWNFKTRSILALFYQVSHWLVCWPIREWGEEDLMVAS